MSSSDRDGKWIVAFEGLNGQLNERRGSSYIGMRSAGCLASRTDSQTTRAILHPHRLRKLVIMIEKRNPRLTCDSAGQTPPQTPVDVFSGAR